MDFINEMIHEEYLEAIGWTLVHSIWQIVLISLLLWAALKFIPGKWSNTRYMAGMTAMILIAIASIVTFYTVLESPADHTDISVAVSASSTGSVVAMDQGEGALAVGAASNMPVIFDAPWISRLEAYLPTLVNLWLLGALFFMVKLFGSLMDLRNFHRQHHETVPGQLMKKVNGMIASLGFYRKVKVLKSHLVQVPITYGVLRPVILLPASLLLHISPRHLEAIIAHELAHIKRYDYLLNILQHTMEVFFFYHPCFWWINEWVGRERENACDDLVLNLGFTPEELAYALAQVAEQAHAATPEMSLAATGNQHPTLNRIKRILGKDQKKEKLSPLITLTMLISLMVSASLVLGAIPSEEKNYTDKLILNELNESFFLESEEPCEDASAKAYVITSSSNSSAKSSHEATAPVTVRASRSTYRYTYKTDCDTTPAPKSVKVIHVSPAQVHASMDEPMPVLELSPVPVFDVSIPPMPTIPPVDVQMPPMPDVQLDINEEALEIGNISMKLAMLSLDTTINAKQQRKELEKRLSLVEKEMEAKTKDFDQKMKIWEETHGEAMKVYEQKMEVWGKEVEAKQAEWEKTYEPKMKEFEKKMEAWQKANEPKIKEFEAKMEAWQQKFQARQQQLQQQQIQP